MAARPALARTLTEALRGFDRPALIALLQDRPDLCYPLPRDFADLSTRASTSTSIARAIERLTAWERAVAEALATQPDPASVTDIVTLLGSNRSAIDSAVGVLRRRALLWGPSTAIHLVRGVREHFEPFPGGLAAPSAQPLSESVIAEGLAACGAAARPVLDKLLWGPPTGSVRNADRAVSPEQAQTPVELLLAHRLLRPMDSETVVLPREVALQLRAPAGLYPQQVSPQPPALGGPTRDPAMVDRAAAGAGFGLLNDLELAVNALEATPHRVLRTGGLSTRDVNALARNLGTDPAHASFVLECAAAAGLVAIGSNLSLLPTTDFDRWAEQESIDQWRTLVEAWAVVPRLLARSAEPGAHTLGDEADAPIAAELRALVLGACAEAPPGTMIEVDQLVALVGWHRPRLARAGQSLTAEIAGLWREAGWLGLAGLGATATLVRAALEPGAELPAEVAELFPAPIDKIIIQADLTAIAPGPLAPPIARDLRLLADQESRGGGGVFRFSATALRRAFDLGWSSTEIQAWLERHSSTGVPQPLSYLVDDVARQYGSVRVAPAGSIIRTEDETQAAALLADPEASTLGLRLLAPGLLVAAADPYEVVALLRKLGRTPAVEDEQGRTLSAPPQPRATAARPISRPASVSANEAADAILLHARSPQPAKMSTADTLQALEDAAREESVVRMSYVTSDGTAAERELSPLDLGAGMVRVVDRANAEVLTIPLARISSVTPPNRSRDRS